MVDPPVVLGNTPYTPPVVLGRAKKRLSLVGYRVVAALLNAGNRGLTREELRLIAHDAPGVLRRLRASDPDWMEVIEVPSGAEAAYRIADPRPPEDDAPNTPRNGKRGRR
ncbi:MAG: hypothetical protein ACLQIB_28240 [Isosphaeraceae bacterium]